MPHKKNSRPSSKGEFPHQLQGMTLLGMLFTLCVVVFLGIVIMRIVPVYIQHYSIYRSLKSVEVIPETECSTEAETNVNYIRSTLLKYFDINGITDVREEHIKISPIESNRYNTTVQYDVERPLFGNISLLFHFKNIVEVRCAES